MESKKLFIVFGIASTIIAVIVIITASVVVTRNKNKMEKSSAKAQPTLEYVCDHTAQDLDAITQFFEIVAERNTNLSDTLSKVYSYISRLERIINIPVSKFKGIIINDQNSRTSEELNLLNSILDSKFMHFYVGEFESLNTQQKLTKFNFGYDARTKNFDEVEQLLNSEKNKNIKPCEGMRPFALMYLYEYGNLGRTLDFISKFTQMIFLEFPTTSVQLTNRLLLYHDVVFFVPKYTKHSHRVILYNFLSLQTAKLFSDSFFSEEELNDIEDLQNSGSFEGHKKAYPIIDPDALGKKLNFEEFGFSEYSIEDGYGKFKRKALHNHTTYSELHFYYTLDVVRNITILKDYRYDYSFLQYRISESGSEYNLKEGKYHRYGGFLVPPSSIIVLKRMRVSYQPYMESLP